MQWIDVEAEIAARVRRDELRTGLDGCAMSTRMPGARGSSSSARSSMWQHHPEEELAEAARGPGLPDLQTSWSNAVASSACGSGVGDAGSVRGSTSRRIWCYQIYRSRMWVEEMRGYEGGGGDEGI
jgi:hypothetical protein